MRITWHYMAIIFPLILLFASLGACNIVERSFVTNFYGPKLIFAILASIYLWIKYLTIPYKIKVIESQSINARSIIKSKSISLTGIYKLRHGYIFTKVYSNDGSIQMSNLMSDFQSLMSIISSKNPDMMVEHRIRK